MKKITGILVALVLTMGLLAVNAEKENYEVDSKESKVLWVGKKVSGKHTGYVMLNKGTLWVHKDKLVGADITLDMNSIECTDLEGEWKDKLVAHLKNDDFFSVDKFPHASFKLTSVSENEVVGDLTIKGITHEIVFPAEVNVSGNKVQAKGKAVIDRTKWDIRYGSGKFFSDLGDRMIYDDFEISFELFATKAGTLSSN